MSQEVKKAEPDAPQPWWTVGPMWMVVGGPAVVVVASFITLYLAVTRPDPVLAKDYYQKGVELNKTLGGTPSSAAPAMQARNHAATGVPVPVEESAK